MRVFVRLLENHRLITIWVPEKQQVSQIKDYIEQSNRSTLSVSQMRLFVKDVEAKDDADICTYVTSGSNHHVFAVLLNKFESSVSTIDYLVLHFPPNHSTFCHLDETIRITVMKDSLTTNDISTRDLSKLMTIVSDRSQIMEADYWLKFEEFSVSIYARARNLVPDSFYYVYIDGSFFSLKNLMGRSFQWSFKTMKLSPLRIQCSLSQHSKNFARLITIDRQSSNLINDTIAAISSKFLEIDPLHISAIHAVNGDDRSYPILCNADVAGLNDSQRIQFHVDSTAPIIDNQSIEVRSRYNWTKKEWDLYYEENWVNDSSGYLAICGKLSEEEESELIYQIVSAFDGREDNKDGIAVSEPVFASSVYDSSVVQEAELLPVAVAQPVSTTDSSILPDFAPMESRMQYWDVNGSCIFPSSIFSVSDLLSFDVASPKSGVSMQSLFVQQLKSHGYAILKLEPKTVSAINNCAETAREYFSLPSECKERNKLETIKWLGYFYNAQYDKELFQMRRCSEEANDTIWSIPGDSNSAFGFKGAMNHSYVELGHIAQGVVQIILSYFGADVEYVDSLMENISSNSSITSPWQFSRSNLTAFRYNSNTGSSTTTTTGIISSSLQCPYHTDLSLVSVIPRSRGGCLSGLYVFDWELNQWVDIERNAPFDSAVVFAGECLSRLTGNELLPCVHEVLTDGSGPRFSLPFLLCPTNDSVLDCSKLPGLSSGKIPSAMKGEVNAGIYMDTLSFSRVSGNFPKR